MNGPRNLREIEVLGWNITASLILQFELQNILFLTFFGHIEDEFHSHLMSQPGLSLSWQEARRTPLAGN